MKILPEHYDHMKAAISRLLNSERLLSVNTDGKSKKRIRWDSLYAIPGMSQWICDNIYPYTNRGRAARPLFKFSTRLRSIELHLRLESVTLGGWK